MAAVMVSTLVSVLVSRVWRDAIVMDAFEGTYAPFKDCRYVIRVLKFATFFAWPVSDVEFAIRLDLNSY